MLNDDPVPADVYGFSPHILPSGDAHQAKRRGAVVEVQSRYVLALGRSTTTPHVEGVTLRSEADPSCNLTKPGVYGERFKHSVGRAEFSNELNCDYYGHLQPTPKSELLAFWDKLKYG
ncbi:hypothetical protein [Glaciibacter psychrotolerans]|uniref:Uncharacterized protein n=1 Tax=Glaciibacter psychrotolerans TaxID=670054 RepID=A0A7Z0J4K5_9MICO|nr:hypothetical protein [Leifsonia psychrotolerans]NYJ18487.1 hypothetical protein [Leifsonia psychrotolerans]